jgi:hypothetical protein
MCYPGLDPSLMCETTPTPLVVDVPDPVEEASSA